MIDIKLLNLEKMTQKEKPRIVTLLRTLVQKMTGLKISQYRKKNLEKKTLFIKQRFQSLFYEDR